MKKFLLIVLAFSSFTVNASELDCKKLIAVAVTNLAKLNFGSVSLDSIKRTGVTQLAGSFQRYTFQTYLNGQQLGYDIQGETYYKGVGCYITKIEMFQFDTHIDE